MPVVALETGLYNALSGGTALTNELGGTYIYNKQAPQKPPAKYVVFQWQGGGDDNDNPNRTRDLIYTVRGIASTQEAAAAIDTEIDTVLHAQKLTVSGWTNFWIARDVDVNFAEQDAGGVSRYHVGAQYRIRIDKD
jgi:hypothetical protein